MVARRILLVFSLLLIPAGSVLSQGLNRFITVKGYITSLQSVMFDSLSGPFVNDNLIHNRINLKGYINNNIVVAAEFRNRLFTGDMIRIDPSFSFSTEDDRGWIDMSWNIIDKQSFFLNTTIDRLWLDLSFGKFQVRAGRQRINWGQTLVWNPNDIFNAYSFFDIDYIERPGSDAIRLQYYPDYSSIIEVAVKTDYNNNITAAGLYRFNRWGYDIQFLAGEVNGRDVVAGTGWSGALGTVSFRGEVTWFQPVKNFSDTTGTGLFTIGFEKLFANNSSAGLQVMYCNNPLDLNGFTSLYSEDLSARSLAFSKFTAFGQFSYPVTPLLNITVSAMWFPDLKGYFAGPSVEYSLSDNMSFSLLWQRFEGEMNDQSSKINLGYLRVKYNF